MTGLRRARISVRVKVSVTWYFSFCDLNPDLMTFIYELDPYCVEVYRMCKYELCTSRLSKVIA